MSHGHWHGGLRPPDKRLIRATSGLRRVLTDAEWGAPLTPADLHKRLSTLDAPGWINLHVDGAHFSAEDVAPLRAWRGLWRSATAHGELPACGVIYTVEVSSGALDLEAKQILSNALG